MRIAAMNGPALGGMRLTWASLTRRIAFSLGLVLGIAILGALAFTARNDLRVVWYDRSRPDFTIGMLRTETQERLDRATGKLAETQEQLRRERETTQHKHRLQQPEQEAQRARAQAAQQTKALELAQQRIAILKKQLAHAGGEQRRENAAAAGEVPQPEQLKERLKSGLKRIR